MKVLISICLVCLPFKPPVIRSGFGYRIHPLTSRYSMHYGIDLRASHDTVYAVFDGRVAAAIGLPDLGICTRLRHSDAEAIYGHLSRTLVAAWIL